MSVMSRCFRRFAAGLVGAFLALALIAVPAWANGDTITAQANVPFSGAVDNPPSCTAHRCDRDDRLGRRQTATRRVDHSGSVSSAGPTRIRPAGTYFGTVTFRAVRAAIAAVAPKIPSPRMSANRRPMFTQCPPVDENSGCQFLITVTNGGETVVQDPNQGPYEGSDDSLIGVQNNSSSTIYELPLSVPGSDLLRFRRRWDLRRLGAPALGLRRSPERHIGRADLRGGRDAAPSRRRPASPRPMQTATPAAPKTDTRDPRATSRTSRRIRASGVVDFSPGLQPDRINLLQPGRAARKHEYRGGRNFPVLARGRPADRHQQRCRFSGLR